MTSLHKTGSQRSNRKRKGLRMRSGSIGTNRVGLVFLIFTCSIGNQPFLVGIIDQLLQPTRNSIEMVENDGYRPLSQLWALIRYKMSTNKTVGVVDWCPLSPGIRPCFQPAEMRSIGTLQPHQPSLGWNVPNRTRPKTSYLAGEHEITTVRSERWANDIFAQRSTH